MNVRAVKPVVKAWISKPGATIDTASLDDLQRSFDNRLNITRGTSGEVMIVAQPQDRERLKKVMLNGGQIIFVEQTIYE